MNYILWQIRNLLMAFSYIFIFTKFDNVKVRKQDVLVFSLFYILMKHYTVTLHQLVSSFLGVCLLLIFITLCITKKKIIAVFISYIIGHILWMITFIIAIIIVLLIGQENLVDFFAEIIITFSFLIIFIGFYCLEQKDKFKLKIYGTFLDNKLVRILSWVLITLISILYIFLQISGQFEFSSAYEFTILIVGLIVALLMSVIFLAIFIFKYAVDENNKKESLIQERINLENYLSEIERQYNNIRSFKHDYQNILTSMDVYFLENDFSGLQNYYNTKIKKISDSIVNHDFQLVGLSNVKIPEIKSILAIKLIYAQESGIDLNFEARNPLEFVNVDTVVLVRILGIVLDNAIEEILNIGYGQLGIAVVIKENTVIFLIENTCSKTAPPIHQIRKFGFSTKGHNRGMGLNNVIELVKNNPTISTQTIIEDNKFIQQITIGE